ncbi:hypothetical protein [Pseudomonas pergaminensis]
MSQSHLMTGCIPIRGERAGPSSPQEACSPQPPPQIAANDKAETLAAIGAGNKQFKPNDYKESEWTNDNHDIIWRVGDGYGSEYHQVKAD